MTTITSRIARLAATTAVLGLGALAAEAGRPPAEPGDNLMNKTRTRIAALAAGVILAVAAGAANATPALANYSSWAG